MTSLSAETMTENLRMVECLKRMGVEKGISKGEQKGKEAGVMVNAVYDDDDDGDCNCNCNCNCNCDCDCDCYLEGRGLEEKR